MRAFTVGILAVSLAACATNIQQYSNFDQSDKSITVPPGGGGLTGQIKSRLAAAGWRMVIDAGPTRTTGTVGTDVSLATADTFNSRYRLALYSDQYDLCLNFQPMIRFDISVIDNRTGAEVMTMSGQDCETAVAEKFIAQLK